MPRNPILPILRRRRCVTSFEPVASAAAIRRAGFEGSAVMASSEHTVGFEPADRLAQDRERVRRRFWIKLNRVVAKLPFAEGLLAAYYSPFANPTPPPLHPAPLP